MSWLREVMIGAHQGRAELHERRARRHRDAEQRWRDKEKPDPLECRVASGRSWDSAEHAYRWAEGYVAWAESQGAVLLEAPMLVRCYDGHFHISPKLRWPETVVIRARYPTLTEGEGTSYHFDEDQQGSTKTD